MTTNNTEVERYAPTTDVSDTDRLNFMLQKCRKVVCETLPPFGLDRHEVYVEEGFMSDKRCPAIAFTGKWQEGSPAALSVQRAAIDAAMEPTK